MNQLTSKNPKINSKRAREFIAEPKHLVTNSLGWSYQLGPINKSLYDDKILTLSYSSYSGPEIETLMRETLSRMCVGKSVGFLIKLNFRELENYLRDENHLSVFEADDTFSIEKSYKYIKNSLLALILWDKCKEGELQFLGGGHWKNLGLAEKNRNLKYLIDSINMHFSLAKPLQLVFVEKDCVSVIINDFPMELEILEIVINQFVNFKEEDSSVKLVAVH